MTYYVINNVATGGMEYFVSDEQTKLANDHIVCFVGGQEEANAKSEQNKKQFLEQEYYRFAIAKEVVDGNNTTWMNADLLNDSEQGMYQVFNQFTGQHEPIDGLSNAVNRMAQLKNDFINQFNWNVSQIDALPPKSISSIPVKVM